MARFAARTEGNTVTSFPSRTGPRCRTFDAAAVVPARWPANRSKVAWNFLHPGASNALERRGRTRLRGGFGPTWTEVSGDEHAGLRDRVVGGCRAGDAGCGDEQRECDRGGDEQSSRAMGPGHPSIIDPREGALRRGLPAFVDRDLVDRADVAVTLVHELLQLRELADRRVLRAAIRADSCRSRSGAGAGRGPRRRLPHDRIDVLRVGVGSRSTRVHVGEEAGGGDEPCRGPAVRGPVDLGHVAPHEHPVRLRDGRRGTCSPAGSWARGRRAA